MRFRNLSMQQQQGLGTLKYYGRYIDDLFMVLEVKKDSPTQWEASRIKEEFNKSNQLLFDEAIVGDQVSYLDALVSLTKDEIIVAPYSKPTTTNLYFPPFSMHYPFAMMSWLCNELNCLLILSSERSIYINAVCEFFN
jgi:hypothetical protein